MDPLSIIASVIAIGSFTTASLEVILKIRGASDQVQALINEISDLSAIIKDVEYTLRRNTRLNAESAGVASLHAVLSKANTTINHLHSFVSSVLMKEETLLRNARISRTAWLREKSQVSRYQRQLLAIKIELSHALGIANLSTGARIELSVANVIALNDHTKNLIHAQLTEMHQLRGEVQDLRQLVDLGSREDVIDHPSSFFQQSNVLPLHSKESNKGADVSLEGTRGLEVQSLFSQGLAAPSDAGHLDGCTALHFAVKRGYVEVIDFLIKSTDADRYALDIHLESPSSHAWDIILGNSMDRETIDFLRATFSDRDFLLEQKFNLVHDIVLGLNGRKLGETLKEQPHLIDSPDNRGNTPLIWAASRGDIENLQELLKHGASGDFRNNNGWNALYTAVNNSRLDCTAILLSYGYTDHKDFLGMTALHQASKQNDATYVQLLLKHDLNVDEQDVFQRCPLALAAWRNSAVVVAYLLDRGANRELRDIFGATPLLRAIQYAAVDAARVLLESTCDVLVVDHESQTVLHRAALSRDIPTINLLTEKSYTLQAIDVNAKDNSGKTARQRLQLMEPSADLLVAFTAMIAGIENAKKTVQAEEALARNAETDQDIFKDAIEFQIDGSPSSSCHTTDNERVSITAHRKGRARSSQPLIKASRNWASKYRNTFRSFDRYLDSASSSTVKLNTSQPKG
ncbi:hypothetical protein MMC27_007191 [Xylographa pallens]|nr:hypothetical protein [Xylographa pallens]